MSNLNEIALAPAGEQPAAAITAATQLECFNPSRKYIGTMEPRERGTYVRREDVERRDAARAAAGVPVHEQDLLDIVRSFCAEAKRWNDLPMVQREHHPFALSPMSALLRGATAACRQRGYGRWGEKRDGVIYPTAQPAPMAAGVIWPEVLDWTCGGMIDGTEFVRKDDAERLLASLAPVAAEPVRQVLLSQRESFEHWFSDEGKSPRAIERSGEGYKLAQAQSAWQVWKACYAALDITGRPSGAPVQDAPQVPTAAEALEKAEAAVRTLAARIKDFPERTGEQESYNEVLEHAIAAIRGIKAPAVCAVPPAGWHCTRKPGHDGPCAAWPDAAQAGLLPVAQTDAASDVQDAARWRALLGTARIRPLGSAGLKTPENRNYAHLGLELWTTYGRDYSAELIERMDRDNAIGIEWLTKFADVAMAAQEAAKGAAALEGETMRDQSKGGE